MVSTKVTLVFAIASLALVSGVSAGSGGIGKDTVFTYGHAAYTYGPLHCTQHSCDGKLDSIIFLVCTGLQVTLY